MVNRALCSLFILLLTSSFASGKPLTCNNLEVVNLRDRGIHADERSTNVLLASGNMVYGATSGDVCHVFRRPKR